MARALFILQYFSDVNFSHHNFDLIPNAAHILFIGENLKKLKLMGKNIFLCVIIFCCSMKDYGLQQQHTLFSFLVKSYKSFSQHNSSEGMVFLVERKRLYTTLQ